MTQWEGPAATDFGFAIVWSDSFYFKR